MDKLLVTGGSGFIGIFLFNCVSGRFSIMTIDKKPPAYAKQKIYWKKIDILLKITMLSKMRF